jgi:hypothetical protein
LTRAAALPNIVQMPQSQLHVFTNQSAHLVQSYYTSPAQVWLQGFDDLLGRLGSSPGACSYLNAGQEQIHVFARGRDNRLWQTFWDGSEWLGWFEFDDRLVESPTVAQFDNEGDVQLHVFYQGHGQQLWQKFYGAGGWLGPFQLPGELASSPAATEYLNEGQRQLHLFFKGPTGMLCQLFYDGVWRGPFELVGPIHSAPAVAQYDHNGQRELHVFYRTAQGSLAQYQYIPGHGWQGPFDRGGTLTDAPAATAYVNSGQSQLHVFGRGQNHHLSQLFFDGRHWLGWFELGQSMSGQPAATSYQQPDLEPANVQVASSGNEPTMALSGTTLAAAWNAPGPQQQVVATSSVGNIQTWSQAASSTPTGLQAWGDVGLASLSGGNFVMVFLGRYFNLNTFDILAARTLAAGGWSAAVNVSNTPTNFDDKPLVAVRAQTCVVTWTDFGIGQIMLSQSTDGGQNWGTPVQVSSANKNGNPWRWAAVPIFGAAGRIFVVWNDSRRAPGADVDGSMYFAVSIDGGQTFKEKAIDFHLDDSPDMDWYPQQPPVTPPGQPPPPAPNGGFRLKSPVAFSRNPANGQLYVAWGDNRFNDRAKQPWDIVFARSPDQGQSWSHTRRVSDVQGKFHYFPWLSCSPDGRLDLVYCTRRLTVQDNGSDVFCQSSWDGGLTWTRALRVSTVTSPITGFMGDYIQCVSDTGNCYPVWTDSRNNAIGVYTAQLPRTRLPSRRPMP